jgi:hypothetical protein
LGEHLHVPGLHYETSKIQVAFVVIIILAAVGMSMVTRPDSTVDMDITKSLPLNDPVIADFQYVMMHHPVKDRIVIDFEQRQGDVERLSRSVVHRRQTPRERSFSKAWA